MADPLTALLPTGLLAAARGVEAWSFSFPFLTSPVPPTPVPQLVSKTFRELADLVLQERFTARWGVAGVSEPPPAAPAYAATRPSFVLCHALRGRESLAALAVRYGADTVALKRLNNLLSDGALLSRCGTVDRAGGGGSAVPHTMLNTRLLPPPQDAPVCASGPRSSCRQQASRICTR